MLGIYEVLVKSGDNQLGLAGANWKAFKRLRYLPEGDQTPRRPRVNALQIAQSFKSLSNTRITGIGIITRLNYCVNSQQLLVPNVFFDKLDDRYVLCKKLGVKRFFVLSE